MSEENQSNLSDTQSPSPPETTNNNITTSNTDADLHIRPDQTIETRHKTLSPVSPSPRHIAEPSDIPVLKNQMDPTFNSAEAHPYLAQSNGAETAQSHIPNHLDLAQHFAQQFQQSSSTPSPSSNNNPTSQQNQQSQQQSQYPSSDATSNLLEALSRSAAGAPPSTHTNTNTNTNTATAPSSSSDQPTSSSMSPNGSAPIVANGTVKSPSGASDSNAGFFNASKPTNLSTTMPSNVDLQALLTKLSPATSAMPTPFSGMPPRSSTAGPQTPVQQYSGNPPGVVSSSAPASAAAASPQGFQSPQASAVSSLQQSPSRTNGTNQSPNIKTTRPASSSLPQPTNHPLPAPVVSSSVPGHPPSAYPASLPPPPSFAQHKQQQAQSAAQQTSGSVADDEEDIEPAPFTVDEEEEFTRFLADERDYVTQGQWDRFPPGSRLFIGNLPTEKVTKRDLFRLFHKHGRLAQVSIKQAYGFIQFLDQSSCASALRHEQGSSVRGRKMHLEISKPQRNTRNAGGSDGGGRRRSRSPPDYGRSNSPRRPATRGGAREGGVDRYRSAPSRDTRDRDRDRERDSYGRDRSPPRFGGRRDDYRPGRRSRSRSRSPPARYRPRSPTPDVDDVPLPRRAPGQVPEVQILVSDELDRNFIWWVEQAFRQRGLTADMLFLNPRLQMAAVVKRQVAEGVNAVVFLNRQHQQTNQITIQIFDRRGEGEATWDQYDDLDPPIAAELVLRSKQAHQVVQPAPVAAYGAYPAAAAPVQQQQQQQPVNLLQQLSAIPNIGNLLSAMDPNTLQQLLTTMQQPQQQQQPHQPQINPDLAALLGGAQQRAPAQQQQYGGGNAMQSFGGTSGLANLLSQAQANVQQAQNPQQAQQQQQQQQQQPIQQHQQHTPGQIGNIMETLAKWKQS